MTCEQIQQRLLACQDPRRPTDEIQYHLAACPACRQWQVRLVEIERHVPFLPVEPAPVPEPLLRQVLGKGAASTAGTTGNLGDGLWLRLAGVGRTRWRLAAGVAAALVWAALGLWLFHDQPGPAPVAHRPLGPDQLVTSLMAHDLGLAEAQTPAERLKLLAQLADDLRAESKNLAGSPQAADVLEELASQYRVVVEDGVVQRARKLRPKDRPSVLAPIAKQLERARTDAETFAHEVPTAASAFRTIADAAKDGSGQLQGLLRE
jgi:hypothetical protein